MRGRASHIVNFGFLLGLVVVTSVTLPDHQKEAGSSETVMKPIETTDHVNIDAKMPVMPQLALVAIPQPSADIQVVIMGNPYALGGNRGLNMPLLGSGF